MWAACVAKWFLPEGLKVSTKPALLDDKLEGKLFFMRWDAPYGWALGKIQKTFTPQTPRLFAKFNYYANPWHCALTPEVDAILRAGWGQQNDPGANTGDNAHVPQAEELALQLRLLHQSPDETLRRVQLR